MLSGGRPAANGRAYQPSISLQQAVVASVLPQPDQAVKADALRPFPGVEADVVAGRAVEVGLVEADRRARRPVMPRDQQVERRRSVSR